MGELYEALEVEPTVMAEYEGLSVGRMGREVEPLIQCLSTLLAPRVSVSENTPATESTRL